jgi:hypothetical protein
MEFRWIARLIFSVCIIGALQATLYLGAQSSQSDTSVSPPRASLPPDIVKVIHLCIYDGDSMMGLCDGQRQGRDG